jgi:demethylmenaquinone methyltransferase/2-methoxy-6-polyprenyl-1,4-benzoquinol methylase
MSSQTVIEMFDGISPHYDFLNHLLSFGFDRGWRRKTSKLVAQRHPTTIIDVATGTADLAIRMAKDNPTAIITGIDLSEKMLEIGHAKLGKKKLDQRIKLEKGDGASLPFADHSFDAVTIAFGIRNFADREAGLREMVRVCRDKGLVAVLEFSHPSSPWIATPYRWYSKTLLPWLGRLVSKHPTAYSYLPSSVAAFPERDTFATMLQAAGLEQVSFLELSGGIATLFYGTVAKSRSKTQ